MIAASILVLFAGFAQTFEVASVKPSAPLEGGGRRMIRMNGGPGTTDPGRITYTGVPLMLILTNAYDVKNFQINGPSWLDSEGFDISAKLPAGTTKEQARVMMQNLLAERFHLTLHHDTKHLQGYEMTVAKGGSKLKESAPEAAPAEGSSAAPPGLRGPPKRDANGFPILDGPGLMVMMNVGPKGPAAHLAAKSQPLSEVARMLSDQLRLPVIDKTGLTGKYDFQLEYSPETAWMGTIGMPPPPGGASASGPPAASDEGGPDLLTAIRQQLGLKLDSKKLPVDILVIDRVDKVPVEN
jgi:uncharacterized protein (TIGR03435 family)